MKSVRIITTVALGLLGWRRKQKAQAVLLATLGAGSFFFSCNAGASSLTYNVNQTIGAASLIGTITTDGTIGNLFIGDIVDWNLTLSVVGQPNAILFTGLSEGPLANSTLLDPTFQDNSLLKGSASSLTYQSPPSGSNFDVWQFVTKDFPHSLVTILLQNSGGSNELTLDYAGTQPLFIQDIQAGDTFATAATPLPATLPLFATGLDALVLLGWWRKRKAQATA
jgi:hypothetical protein